MSCSSPVARQGLPDSRPFAYDKNTIKDMPSECPEKSVTLMTRALKAMDESSAMVAHSNRLLGSGNALLESSRKILSQTSNPRNVPRDGAD